MLLTALITPFLDNSKIDWQSLQKLLNFQLASSIDGLIILGSTGETVTLSAEEQDQILDFVIKIAQKSPEKQIWVGISDNSTDRICDKIAKYNSRNINGYLIACPHYNKPQQNGLIKHFQLCDQTSQKPIILYNIPGRTGVNLEPQTLQKILQTTKNIHFIKESSGNMEQVSKYQQIILEQKANCQILAGDDWAILPFLSLAAVGCVSVVSNLYPEEMADIIQKFKQNSTLAHKAFYNFLPEIQTAFIQTNPVCIKNMLYKADKIDTNQVRLPLMRMED